jgi:hypothetical protein
VLDAVDQQFRESAGDVLAHPGGHVGGHFSYQLGGPLGGFELRADVQRAPLRPGGNHPQVVAPGGSIECLLHHVRYQAWWKRLVKVTICPAPDGGQGARRVGVAGQNHARFRPQRPNLPQQRPAIPAAVGLRSRHHHFAGQPAQQIHGLGRIVGVFNGAVFAAQKSFQRLVNRRIGIQNQQKAWRQIFPHPYSSRGAAGRGVTVAA